MTFDTFLTTRQVCAIIGGRENALNNMIRKGLFPRPFLIGVRRKGWKKAEVDAWLADRDRARAEYADPAIPNPLTEAERNARYEAHAQSAAA